MFRIANFNWSFRKAESITNFQAVTIFFHSFDKFSSELRNYLKSRQFPRIHPCKIPPSPLCTFEISAYDKQYRFQYASKILIGQRRLILSATAKTHGSGEISDKC